MNESLRFYAQQQIKERKIQQQLEERKDEQQRLRELEERFKELQSSLLKKCNPKKENEMNVEFNENIVEFSEGKIVASVLLREGRNTPVLWMKFTGLKEVSKLALEEEVFKCFEKPWNKPVTNADLWVNWIQDENVFILRVEVKPSEDIEPGCFIKIDKIIFF